LKFARNEDVSSVFDFSKVGRRMTEGPPDIIFLGVLVGGGRGIRVVAYEVERTSFIVRIGGLVVLVRVPCSMVQFSPLALSCSFRCNCD